MKIVFVSLALLFVFTQCAEEPTNEVDSTEQNVKSKDNVEEKESVEISIFQSNNKNGTVEYMERHVSKDGTSKWIYSTKKRPKKIELGVTTDRGIETVFFKSDPSVLYEIGGSECGFSLIDNKDQLQWFGQIEPECDMDDFYKD